MLSFDKSVGKSVETYSSKVTTSGFQTFGVVHLSSIMYVVHVYPELFI